MRRLTSHRIVKEDQKTEAVSFEDEPNKDVGIDVHDVVIPKGEAPYHYVLYIKKGDFSQKVADLRFHKSEKGRVNEQGEPCPTPTNGITIEALIAVCIDRLEKWQEGPFACRENKKALLGLTTALVRIQERTEDRIKRGVKGLMKS